MKHKSIIALLRGINVGGSNLIKMADLKICFEAMGFQGVKTYIQSGNVLFGAGEAETGDIAERIEKTILQRFGVQTRIIILSLQQLREVVGGAPPGFGKDPAQYRYDVLFLKEPLTSEEAFRGIPLREGVDAAWKGSGVIYFSRLISQASRSYLSKIVSLPVYQQMTIRNWNTTTKLLALSESGGSSPGSE